MAPGAKSANENFLFTSTAGIPDAEMHGNKLRRRKDSDFSVIESGRSFRDEDGELGGVDNP
jgi:hypothetical protein